MNNAIIHKYAHRGRNQQPVMFIIFDQKEAYTSFTSGPLFVILPNIYFEHMNLSRRFIHCKYGFVLSSIKAISGDWHDFCVIPHLRGGFIDTLEWRLCHRGLEWHAVIIEDICRNVKRELASCEELANSFNAAWVWWWGKTKIERLGFTARADLRFNISLQNSGFNDSFYAGQTYICCSTACI